MLKTLLIILALLMPSSLAAPNEASGIVIKALDGDTVEIQDLGRIRLADIDCPEINRPGGQEAANYTIEHLLNKKVYLDIDGKSKFDNTGDGRYVCVVYLANPDGSLNASRNFNRMLVDAGQAYIQDYPTNEFNPADWWGGQIPACTKNESVTGTKNSIVIPGLPIPQGENFIGSVKSRKYHSPSCKWAKRINNENEIWFSDAKDAEDQGYVPCKVCNPE
jgi:micrococcal nuclease